MKKLVLFDFDGTVADSAPDLANSANTLRLEQGLEPLSTDYLRPYASMGARGLIWATIGLKTDHPDYEDARQRFLDHYENNLDVDTVLFPGMGELLHTLSQNNLPWGIVTNKAEYLTRPIMKHLGIYDDCAVLVGGDSTPYLKPHPAALFRAARLFDIPCEQCIYIGDDERDIVSAQVANMSSVVAAYGYCQFSPETQNWGADAIANHADEIYPIVKKWAAQLKPQHNKAAVA